MREREREVTCRVFKFLIKIDIVVGKSCGYRV